MHFAQFVRRFGQEYGLSSRETDVLTLTALGLHRKEVAFRLGCQWATVDTYWRRIARKTRSTSQAEVMAALLWAALAGASGFQR
jgi:DNA-binding CsgD family transcriptional regulator